MNSIDWLKSVRKNPQKSPVPPVPPEAPPVKNPVKPHIPPETPCSSLYLNESEKRTGDQEQPEIYWGDTPEPPTSGGHRGNQTFQRGNEVLDHRGDGGNQGKTEVSEPVPLQDKPLRLPYITADGTLSIPFDSDPKYHWWKGGQSVDQTRAEVVTRMEAEYASHKG